MKQLLLFSAICCFLLLSGSIVAQDLKIPTDTTQLTSVETKDGNEFVGYVMGIEADYLVLKTEQFGRVTIRKLDIKSIRPVSQKQIVEGEYWYENPYSTRYFFGPNGYGLHKGEGYYQNAWIWFNQVSYGFSDNFTLGVGMIPLFIFAGAPTPVWLTPKVSIPLKRDMLNLGVGGLFAFVLGEDSGSFGVAYGQMTIGSRDRNMNLGLGYGYAGDSWANTPTVTISGMYRTGKKFALLTENYLFDAGDETFVLLSFGGRFIGRRVAIDAGLFIPTQTDGEVIGIPWLGVNVPFGSPSK